MDRVKESRVLLVEDDPGDRWIISEILRSRGHVVTACDRAETAWERYQENPFSLALLDWILPGTDGLELCRRIRGHPHGDRTVILLVTGRDGPEDLEEVLRAGADDYVAKPVDVGLMNVRLAVAEKEIRDVHRRKETQEALAAKSREFERLVSNLDRVFFSVDLEAGCLVQVSPGTESLLGVSAEELRADEGLWRRLLFPPELEEQLEKLEPGAGRAASHQGRVTTPDGRRIWLEASVKPVSDDGGRPSRVDGIVSDVTDRLDAQLEAAARTEELRTLYRISETLFSARSLDEAYEEIVSELHRATGFPIVAIEQYDPDRVEMVIRAARGIDAPEGDAAMRIPLGRTLSGVAVREGRPVIETDAPSRTEHADPTLVELAIRTYLSFPVIVSGEPVGTLTLAHTRSVEPDDRLVRWAGSLAKSVGALVDRLRAREALIRSEREHRATVRRLERANEELESFAYTVSHDLRAPLRTMEGFAHALLQDYGEELNDEARDYIRRIIESGRQAESLIGDLLDYSRLSFEEVGLVTVELEEVVDTVLDQMAADVEAAGARIRVDRPLPRVRSHTATLTQVIGNLISNAIKFVPEGRTPRVEVRTETVDGRIRLWVEDNGMGIPPEQSERIFRVFERLVESGDRPGTGIGLAIVQRGMERIGGTVGVESDGQEGCRFWIEVPTPGSTGPRS